MISIARVKQATNEFVKVLRYGKRDIKTAEHVLPAGIESKPVGDDVAVHAITGSTETTVCVGYIRGQQKTKEGETVVYSTDANGERQLEFYFRNDGKCELGGNNNNLTQFQELKSGFDQLKSDLNSLVSAYNAHTHPDPSSGSTGTTSNPGSSSTASVDNAEINYLLVE